MGSSKSLKAGIIVCLIGIVILSFFNMWFYMQIDELQYDLQYQVKTYDDLQVEHGSLQADYNNIQTDYSLYRQNHLYNNSEYEIAKEDSYSKGYNIGNETGFSTGYSKGYNTGYIVGNLSGYETGYNMGYGEGYLEGNLSGYDVGYSEGRNVGYSAGNSSGYETGYDAGYVQGVIDGAGRGYNIRDPTYQEALQFIASDQTDKNEYTENYTCFNFAADFKTNAFDTGYRCGWVYIEFPEVAHSIVCFNTTDSNIIFIEPQYDEIVNVIVGEPYWDRTKYEPPPYDDTIIYFAIIW